MSFNRKPSSIGILFFFYLLISALETQAKVISYNFKYDGASLGKALKDLECFENYNSMLMNAGIDYYDIAVSHSTIKPGLDFPSHFFPSAFTFEADSGEAEQDIQELSQGQRNRMYKDDYQTTKDTEAKTRLATTYAWCAFGKVKKACKDAAAVIQDKVTWKETVMPSHHLADMTQTSLISTVAENRDYAYMLRYCLLNQKGTADSAKQNAEKPSVVNELSVGKRK